MKKQCTKCGTLKELHDFSKDKRKKSGYGAWCKECTNKNTSIWSKKNKLKGRIYSQRWREKHPEYIKEYAKKYLAEHPNYVNEWQKNNLEKCNEKTRRWRKNNILKSREYNRKSDCKRRKDISIRLAESVSSSINHYLRHGSKRKRRYYSLLGYNIDQLKKHLEKQFTPEMTWENYGSYWHIDHIIPVSAFNFATPEDIDFKRCWALSNLQPLEKRENLKKSNKLMYPFQPSLRMVA